MFSEDLEPKGGILSRRKRIRRYLGIIEEDTEGVEGIVCYGKMETLGDAEEAARRWRYNLVR